MLLRQILSDFKYALYPNLCLMCEEEVAMPEHHFCLGCQLDLPFTDHYEVQDNGLMKHFWGRCNVEMGAALFSFRKHNQVRKMVHRMKYHGRKDIGIALGKMMAERYLNSPHFHPADCILTVPLSQHKTKKRGFNQVDILASGFSAYTSIPIHSNILIKAKKTDSQTRKTRLERVHNVKNAYQLTYPDILHQKHVLLMDDVITTGATLEVCAKLILSLPGTRVSILTAGISRSE